MVLKEVFDYVRKHVMDQEITNVSMEQKEIIVNTQLAANFLASLLKKQWQNIGSIYIKSTMGPAIQIYF